MLNRAPAGRHEWQSSGQSARRGSSSVRAASTRLALDALGPLDKQKARPALSALWFAFTKRIASFHKSSAIASHTTPRDLASRFGLSAWNPTLSTRRRGGSPRLRVTEGSSVRPKRWSTQRTTTRRCTPWGGPSGAAVCNLIPGSASKVPRRLVHELGAACTPRQVPCQARL